MDSANSRWETPRITALSVRATRATNGSDTDAQGGGVFLFEGPVNPPTGKWGEISGPDKARVAEFLHSVSSSPDNLHAAIIKPNEAMERAGLTKDQIKIARGVLTHLGR